MIDDRSFEALLHESLGRSGQPAPFAVDVTEMVMAQVDALGVPTRAEVSGGQLARWAAAAAVFGVSLLTVLAWKGPSSEGLLSTLGFTMAGGATVLSKLMAPASALGGALGRVLTALAGSAQTVVQPLAAFQPLARALLVVLTAGMLGITTVIVGRDMRSHATDEEHA